MIHAQFCDGADTLGSYTHSAVQECKCTVKCKDPLKPVGGRVLRRCSSILQLGLLTLLNVVRHVARCCKCSCFIARRILDTILWAQVYNILFSTIGPCCRLCRGSAWVDWPPGYTGPELKRPFVYGLGKIQLETRYIQ